MRLRSWLNVSWIVILGVCSSISHLIIPVQASTSNEGGQDNSYRLLNAYAAPLSALTAPGNFYFMEFPLDQSDQTPLSPVCGDGTPYSFAFRRGSEEHLSKLVVELEVGPTCWGQDTTADGPCCNDDAALQTPWYKHYKDQEEATSHEDAQRIFPPLNICTGITPGFMKLGAEDLFVRNGYTDSIPGDLPVALRNVTTADDQQVPQWWEVLGGNAGSDWSYLLIPQCTMDSHLGHQFYPQSTVCDDNTVGNDKTDDEATNITSIRSVYHRGGVNLDAVLTWIERQFPEGLEALVVLSGGKVGGCNTFVDASSIASAILASKLSGASDRPLPNDALVVTAASALWKQDLPSPDDLKSRWNTIDIPEGNSLLEGLDDWIRSTPENVHFAWLTSDDSTSTRDEDHVLQSWQSSKGGSFHVIQAPSSEDEDWCPIYAFPTDANSESLATSLTTIVNGLSWTGTLNTETVETQLEDSTSDGGFRLSFLGISLVVVAFVALLWIGYFIIKAYQKHKGKALPLSPTDLWFLALTRFPGFFLFLSVLLPVSLSYAGYAENGHQISVNLDFDSYLTINTPLENTRRSYAKARARQQESLSLEAENCELLHDASDLSFMGRRDLLEDKGFSVNIDRELSSNFVYASGGEVIALIYQNRNGGNVFEHDVLQDIYEFEQGLYDFPGFSFYCFGFFGERCIPIDSLVTHFFPDGNIVSDLDSVVQQFLGNQPALWKLDQNFGPENLQSNVIRSFIFLKDFGGDQRETHPFLKSLYRDYFWKIDQDKVYSSMIHTWDNTYLGQVEANDALRHDTLWSIGSLCFLALMIIFKVQSLFVAFCSMLGLVLAFSVSYYWTTIHFAVDTATLLWVAGLYVMLGVGADDIFLMFDTFEHCESECCTFDQEQCEKAMTSELHRDVLRERMGKAYRKAGGMMLVSSVTTAICFFSNAFGALVAIQEFGIFMGMVAVMNFLHVMTILPAALLVNEFYVVPCNRQLLQWSRKKFPHVFRREANEDATVQLGSQTGLTERSCAHEDNEMTQMNRMDRWLVHKYFPFMRKRAFWILFVTLILAIILGILGTVMFSMSDGKIVLFTEKYNLGRLAVVTDKYFNKDVSKTIEANNGPTAASSTTLYGSTTGTSGVGLPESATQGGGVSSGTSGIPANSGNTVPNQSPIGSSSTGSPPSSTGSGNGSAMAGIPANSGHNVPNQSPTGSSSTGSPPSPTGSGDGSAMASEGPYTGSNAVIPLGPNAGSDLRRRDTIAVNLIWGIIPDGKDARLWKVDRKTSSSSSNDESVIQSSPFDLSSPAMQAVLLEAVRMARNDNDLNVQHDKMTWIEMLHDFAVDSGIEFPVPQDLFIGYVNILKERNADFAALVKDEIGTQSPGLTGEFTFVSITMQVDAQTNGTLSLSETVYRQWTAFAQKMNEKTSSAVPKLEVQSRIFVDAYRVEAAVQSTVSSWIISNVLCLLVILLFTRNVALSLMVMATILLMLFCLGGFIFSIVRIPFGAIEALGVSIFIGLSANYSLHVVHAYQHSKGKDRSEKVREAIFAVGSPIVASAVSTIGASIFLFGCRTWVFVELGILICSITALALLYSMTFLLAWLAVAGPRPFESEGRQMHSWDFGALWRCQIRGRFSSKSNENQENLQGDKLSVLGQTIDIDGKWIIPVRRPGKSKIKDDDSNDSIVIIVDDHLQGMVDGDDENDRADYEE